MCNYGQAPPVTGASMVWFVQQALETIRSPLDELLVSPSGNMLDPAEVPLDARRRIYGLVAAFQAPKICIETRAETVTPETVDELATALPSKQVAVEMGLESSSAWILRFCMNKVSEPSTFTAASDLLRSIGMRVYANLSLGPAFLTAGEAIEDAYESVSWALEHGADTALVFPMHVKPHTLLSWLRQRDSYRPPSLWSLIEVLARIEPRLLPRVNISWYRSNDADGSQVSASPTTCPRCRSRILTLLDGFREQPCASTVVDLASEECGCKDAWRREIATVPDMALPARVLRHYEALARGFGLSEWWAAHHEEVRDSVLSSR